MSKRKARAEPPQMAGTARKDKSLARLAWIVAILILTALVYLPVRDYSFISFDDPAYVSENAHIAGGLSSSSLAWAFTAVHAGYWIPLTWVSYMADVGIAGTGAGPHHVTNVLLHLVNTALLFAFVLRTTGAAGRSAFVAALFAVHPLHVESVAWVTERKDVLSTLFLLLALGAYATYVRRPSWRRYLLVVACFAAGLMAKPMLVTFPVVLLLLDVWPLGRLQLWRGNDAALEAGAVRPTWRRLIVEKIPFFILAAASGVVTFFAQQRGGAIADLAAVGPTLRAANVLIAYGAYLVKTVWPAGLAVFYPYHQAMRPWMAGGAALLLLAISLAVFRSMRTHPAPAVGWLWYLVTLLPVIGIVQAGDQAMADRFTYVPLIGLFILVAWGVPDVARFRRWWRPTLAAAIVLALAATARDQVQTWQDDATLWQHALDVSPDNFLAHDFLGRTLLSEGNVEAAATHFADAVRLNPSFPDGHANLGLVLARQGRLDEAIVQYRAAVRLQPGSVESWTALGAALGQRGRLDEALAAGLEALRVNPGNAEAHYNVGSTLARMGALGDAEAHYRETVRLKPDLAAAQAGLGEVLARQGRPLPAISALEAALRIDPTLADVHRRLGQLLVGQGRLDAAIVQYDEALRLEPGRPDVQTDLGFALAGSGRVLEAIPHFNQAVRLAPDFALAHYYLGLALAGIGRFDDASGQLADAVRLDPTMEGARRALASLPRRGPR